MLHDQPRQLLHLLAQLTRMLGHVGQFLDFGDLVHAQRTAGQLVDPAQAAQIHLAGKLVQSRRGQVVGLIEHEQAIVQLGQQLGAQRGKQQIMIGDNDLRRHQVFAAFVIDAVAEGRAVLSGA